jgi:hypothetical protein
MGRTSPTSVRHHHLGYGERKVDWDQNDEAFSASELEPGRLMGRIRAVQRHPNPQERVSAGARAVMEYLQGFGRVSDLLQLSQRLLLTLAQVVAAHA